MTPKDTPEDKAREAEPKPTGEHKHRKHGYRGYPNNPAIGGDIHIGTGFAGVGSTGTAGSSGSSLITDKTREAVDELEEEEKDK